MTPDWAAKPTTVPYASFGDPQSLNLDAFVENTPVNRADADGHASDAGFLQRPFESFGGSVYASAQAAVGLNDATFEVFLRNGDVLLMLAAQVQALAQNTSQTQTQSNQQSNAPANSRTDVLLYSNEYTPKPTKETAWFWETTWKAGTCSGDRCSQSSANNGQTISLVESKNGAPFKAEGKPMKGTAHDEISPEPKTFNQRWFVDGKQVQLVVGKDSKGSLVKTWEVHVVINKLGDRPTYSPVP